MHPTPPLLVIGGTGKTGRRVAERLSALGLPVRACSRHTELPFDWDDRTTWGAALDGVRAAYITFAPDVAMPGAAGCIAALAELALGRGVRRLVLLSGRGEPGAQRAEEALQASGADWTVLRCGWFAQNFSEGPFLEGIQAGELALPVGEVPEPFLDVQDIADVAVAALLGERHIGQLYELTGPRLLTFAEAVQEIALATGRPIRYQQVSPEAFKDGLDARGTPPELTALLLELFSEVLDGRNSHLVGGVQQVLGRPPRDFRQYARDTARTGVWGVA